MIQLIITVLMTIAVVIFSITNSHHVELSFVIGAPVKIRLIFLLLSTFITGMTVPIYFHMVERLKNNKKLKMEQEFQEAVKRVDRDLLID